MIYEYTWKTNTRKHLFSQFCLLLPGLVQSALACACARSSALLAQPSLLRARVSWSYARPCCPERALAVQNVLLHAHVSRFGPARACVQFWSSSVFLWLVQALCSLARPNSLHVHACPGLARPFQAQVAPMSSPGHAHLNWTRARHGPELNLESVSASSHQLPDLITFSLLGQMLRTTYR